MKLYFRRRLLTSHVVWVAITRCCEGHCSWILHFSWAATREEFIKAKIEYDDSNWTNLMSEAVPCVCQSVSRWSSRSSWRQAAAVFKWMNATGQPNRQPADWPVSLFSLIGHVWSVIHVTSVYHGTFTSPFNQFFITDQRATWRVSYVQCPWHHVAASQCVALL